MNTTEKEVFDSFESSFEDRKVIPIELERVWLLKAIGRYSLEIEPLAFDEDSQAFDSKLERYIIDTLGAMMKQLYQEREVSRINKQTSIVTKDVSIDSRGYTKNAAKNELDYDQSKVKEMLDNQKPTAYV